MGLHVVKEHFRLVAELKTCCRNDLQLVSARSLILFVFLHSVDMVAGGCACQDFHGDLASLPRLASTKVIVSARGISHTLDKTACWVSLSLSPLMSDILTHLSTSNTFSPYEQWTLSPQTAASPRTWAANCCTGSSCSFLSVTMASMLTLLLCFTK